MSGHPDRIVEHYRKLAAEEVALAKVAVTNEARAKHYARAAEYWRLAQTERGKRDYQAAARSADDARQHAPAWRAAADYFLFE